jgi:predicted permease
MVPLGNTAFMGIPMVEAFFGSGGLPYAILYDQLGSFLALSTYGAVVMAIYSSRDFSPKPGAILIKILKFPPFIALVMAFLFRAIEYPQSIEKTLVKLAGTLIPLVMVSIGMQLKLRIAPARRYPLFGGLVLKLIISPVIAILFCKLLGINDTGAMVSVFQAGMPPMVMAGVMAISAGLEIELVTALVGLGLIFAFFTLPLLHHLILFTL